MTKRIALFAGTTEGRRLAEYLESFPVQVWMFTATEYGKASLGAHRKAEIRAGRMNRKEMEQFLRQEKIGLAVDATHPFAKQATENIRAACEACGISYLRCLREHYSEERQDRKHAAEAGRIVRVDSVSAAVEYLKKTSGNIFITTGTKDLKTYTELPDFQERCYARVLSAVPSVSEACALGFTGRHLLAMQGPFSKEMNVALLHETAARYLVTKESGKTGGFPEKQEAARETGAVLVVIERPQEEGLPLEQAKVWIRKWMETSEVEVPC